MLRKLNTLKYFSLISLILFLLFLFPEINKACSVFCIDKGGNLIRGRSYDWGFGDGKIYINKRGQLKKAFRYWDEKQTGLATWTSKYGSITFNQYGSDNAFDGMNEAGLVVSELWLEESIYPAEDSRPSISLDQYVQYLLDNFKSVDEIIASDSSIRLRPTPSGFTKIHFFATDITGDCIVIEFINGKMVYHTKETMPVKAITNSTYESSISFIKSGIIPDPTTDTRFYRISKMLEEYVPATSGDVIDYTYRILDAVKAGGSWTKFQTAFDIKNRVIYFKSLQNAQLRHFHFDAFDFSCQTGAKILDINANYSGDVTDKFSDYTTQANEALVKKAWEDLGYFNVYLPALQLISRYPGTFTCKGTTEIENKEEMLPTNFKLFQNYPNPFNPSTVISYQLPVNSNVRLKIYDPLGREVATLVDQELDAGNHEVNFDVGNLTSGIYIYTLRAGSYSEAKKLILIK